MAYVSRAALRMTENERSAFLDVHDFGRLSTVNPTGEPHVAPVGYVALGERIYFHALLDSRRGRDLAAGSLACLCVDDGVSEGQGYGERRGVIVYARCSMLAADDERLPEVRQRFADKFFGDPGARFERRTHAWYELVPYRFASWDFGRIPAGADSHAQRAVQPPST